MYENLTKEDIDKIVQDPQKAAFMLDNLMNELKLGKYSKSQENKKIPLLSSKLSENINSIVENVQDALESHQYCLGYNLKNFIRHILWKTISIASIEGNYGPPGTRLEVDLDKIINTIIETSAYDGPKHEEYPSYNKKIIGDEITRVEQYMKKINLMF